ncbi:MAG: CheR family methyltransferase [Rhizomicrobium sp.]
MNGSDFEYMATLLRNRAGIMLGEDKTYLLETRLMAVARKHGLSAPDQIPLALRNGCLKLEADVIEAMTTNETLFFRDRHPFDALQRDILPEIIALREQSKCLRIWSAACSTGQEPYSIAMLIRDFFPLLSNWQLEIVATDISPLVLNRARDGLYTNFEVQRGLPVQLLVRHFEQMQDMWRIRPELRRMVTFREFNLLDDPVGLGTFDIIFCRNVLLYFDVQTKRAILERMSQRLRTGGALLLGASETVYGISDAWVPDQQLRAVYRRNARQLLGSIERLMKSAAPETRLQWRAT